MGRDGGEEWGGTEGMGGEGCKNEVKQDYIYLKFCHLKNFVNFIGTDRQTDKQTNRQTDRQTDIVIHREVTLFNNLTGID